MKIRTSMLFCILCLVTLIVLGSCSTMKTTEKMTYEKFCGTWVNTKYEGKINPPVKWIFNPDGTLTSYSHLHNSLTYSRSPYTVEKRWTDSEGNSWYHFKIEWAFSGTTEYLLFKLDRYNAILEYNRSGTAYPTEVSPEVKYSEYRIYYRY